MSDPSRVIANGVWSSHDLGICMFDPLTVLYMISNKTKGNYWGAAYATFKMVDTPGYFVHQWNVRLKDVIPTNYVSIPLRKLNNHKG